MTASTAPVETPPLDSTHRSEGTRRFRYGGNTFAMVALCVAVLVVANLVMTKVKVRWDVTGEGLYTLSDQTTKVVANLKEPVKVMGFFTINAAAGRDRAQDLLKEYQAHTDKLSVEMVDIDKRLGLAQQMGVQQDGTLIFQMGDKLQSVTAATEGQVTGALLKLTSDKQTTVYFVTGHGERAVDDTAQNGLSMVRGALEKDNFVVQPLNLATAGDDEWKQGVVVVNSGMRISNVGGRPQVAPAGPLLPDEKAKLVDFVKGGGRMLLLLSPGTDPSYNDLLAPAGLKLGDGVVIDPAASFGDVTTPAVQRPSRSNITEALPITLFPRAAAIVDEGDRPAGVVVQPLMEASDRSWLETDLQSQPKFDEGKDIKGPVRLAASVELPGQDDRKGQMVVISSVDAFANGVLEAFVGTGNQDFFLNSVNWLGQQDEAIGIRPKNTSVTPVVLTQNQYPMVLLSSALLFPGLILLAGLGTWWSRR